MVIAEYRGFGISADAGEPSEQGLYRDASAVVAAVSAQGIGRERIVLLGESLGTGVAAEMARRGAGSALVLVSPYTSITELAQANTPFLPMSLLLTEKFETLSKASSIGIPTLIVHGDADEAVPFAMGQRLAAAIPGAKLHAIPGGHHNDLWHLWSFRGELVDSIAAFARH
jgi:fermentation-respiration switch protein FrsA (DUF1100 family)